GRRQAGADARRSGRQREPPDPPAAQLEVAWSEHVNPGNWRTSPNGRLAEGAASPWMVGRWFPDADTSGSAAGQRPAEEIVDVVEERTAEHPLQVARVARDDLGKGPAGVLPEREGDLPRVVPAEPAGDVHLDQRCVEFRGRSRQRMPPDLPSEHLGRR